MNQKRTPAGVPTGGEFAANTHDEASASLGSESASDERYVWQGTEYDGAELVDVMVRTGELSPGARGMSPAEAFEQYNAANVLPPGDVDAVSRARPADEPSFAAGFPGGRSTGEQVQWAIDNSAALTVDTDMGEIEMSGDDLSQAWDDLAPGEGFEIRGARRLDPDLARNPYGASQEAITEANRIGQMIAERGIEDPDVTAAVTSQTSTPESRADYYNALASHMPLTDDRRELLNRLADEHDVSRADIDEEIGNEFGMPIDYQDGDTTRFFTENPNRIINRITEDYLEEVVQSAARNRWE